MASSSGGNVDVPTFSVVTAAYNAASTVAATIQSVIAQSCDDWEMIVVDDGSTDGTGEVAQDAAAEDPRVRVIRQDNAGVSAARNAAIANAAGEYVCILDADDRYRPEYLSAMREFIGRFPDLDLYSCNGDIVFPQGLTVPFRKGRRFSKPQMFSLEEMFDRNMIFIMVTVRRAAFERIGGFRLDLDYSEDYDAWMRILLTGGANVYNPQRLGLYRLTQGSVSTDYDRLERYRLEVIERLAQEYPDRVSTDTIQHAVERQRKRVELAVAERRLARGDMQGVRAAFFSAWPVLPTMTRRYLGGLTMLMSPRLYRRVFLARLYQPTPTGVDT